MRRRDRGVAFVWALIVIVLIGFALSFTITSGARETRVIRSRTLRMDGLHEARGGVRWAEAQLEKGDAVEPWTREDSEGKLEVRIEGDTITSIFTLKRAGRPVTRRVTARWRRTDRIEIFDWSEE